MSTEARTVATLVMKFGGTSVADADAVGRLVSIVREGLGSGGAPPVVVVSATSGTTDQLLALAADAQRGLPGANDGLDRVLARHRDLARALTSGDRASGAVRVERRELEDLRASSHAVSILRESRRGRSMQSPRSAKSSASRICRRGVRGSRRAAAWVDARRALVTEASTRRPCHSRPRRGRQSSAKSCLTCATVWCRCWEGSGRHRGRRHDHPLGRGGSDYSGGTMGAALTGLPAADGGRFACREIQIWTDVDGMLTADPRVVEKQPRR